MGLLPQLQIPGQFERALMVPDEVVVDDEDKAAPAELEHSVELRNQLIRRLGSGPPAIDRDDVAELALKWTASRELHCHGDVLVHVEQIEAGNRRLADIGLVMDHIEPLGGAALKISDNAVKHLVRLAHDHVVCQ